MFLKSLHVYVSQNEVVFLPRTGALNEVLAAVVDAGWSHTTVVSMKEAEEDGWKFRGPLRLKVFRQN